MNYRGQFFASQYVGVSGDKPDEFLAQCQLSVVLRLLQQRPAGLNVADQLAFRRNVHAPTADLQARLDVEELHLDVAAFTVPARIVSPSPSYTTAGLMSGITPS